MIKEFAKQLDGCTKLYKKAIEYAKKNDIVIAIADDYGNLELRGAIERVDDDMHSPFILINKNGVITNLDACIEALKTLKDNGLDRGDIELISSQSDLVSIRYMDYKKANGEIVEAYGLETKIPHEKFLIHIEDEDLVGIVFKKSDLK